MQLREYQITSLEKVGEHLGQGHSVLVAAPTAAGKGTMAVELAYRYTNLGIKVLFLAHRREIVQDYVERCEARGFLTGTVVGGRPYAGEIHPSMAMSIQSLLRQTYVPEADLIILDEAHHYGADQWGRILDIYPKALRVGMSATPWRSDGAPLSQLFDKLVVSATYSELIGAGMIVPCQVVSPKANLGRDVAVSPLQAYQEYGMGSTLVFVVNKFEAARELKAFRAAGVDVDCVTESTPDGRRRKIFRAFKSGQLRVLINVFIATEGLDVPRCKTIVLARPCSHLGTYIQIVGRGLRTFPGKSFTRLIDLTGASQLHGIPTLDRDYTIPDAPIDADTREGTSKDGNDPGPVVYLDVPMFRSGYEPTEVEEAVTAIPPLPDATKEPHLGKYRTGTYTTFQKDSNLWSAKVPGQRSKCIGHYHTEEEAKTAVAKWLEENPDYRRYHPRRGKGRYITYHQNRWQAKTPFGEFISYYDTEAEALAAVQAWKDANPDWESDLTQTRRKPVSYVEFVKQSNLWRARRPGSKGKDRVLSSHHTEAEALAAVAKWFEENPNYRRHNGRRNNGSYIYYSTSHKKWRVWSPITKKTLAFEKTEAAATAVLQAWKDANPDWEQGVLTHEAQHIRVYPPKQSKHRHYYNLVERHDNHMWIARTPTRNDEIMGYYETRWEAEAAVDAWFDANPNWKKRPKAGARYVTYNKNKRRWHANEPGACRCLGTFKTEAEALAAVQAWKDANPGWDK